MAGSLTEGEWEAVWRHFVKGPAERFGLPAEIADTVVFGSWNIRKFGEFAGKDGVSKRSAGAWQLIVEFCRRCDLLAIQETQTSMASVFELRDRMNAARPTARYKIIGSDVTGESPGKDGMPERMVFLFDEKRVEQTEIASDITHDLTEVLANVNKAIVAVREDSVRLKGGLALKERASVLFEQIRGFTAGNLPNFLQFIRSPHVVTFRIPGSGAHYDLACVNAHLVFRTAIQREREFFALLEWLILRSRDKVWPDAPVFLLLADLNLDFQSSHDLRRQAIAKFITSLNRKRLTGAERVNFPFLDPHPVQGSLWTNARGQETFDHIAFISGDRRFPSGRHNDAAGKNGFDYGMFDFMKLLTDSGTIGKKVADIDYGKIVDDISDHMPIWLRMPRPHAGQHEYPVP